MAKHSKGATGATDSTTYLLRDVPNSIWHRARSRAVLENRPIRDVIIELLDRWAYESGQFQQPKAGRKRR